MKGSFKNTTRKMTYFPPGSHHQMMLDMAQLQIKQPFLGLAVAVYEYTTSVLYPSSSLGGWLFWFHSIVCALLGGMTFSPSPTIHSYFQTNVYQTLFYPKLIFFSTIVSVYKCIQQKERTGASLFLNSHLEPGSHSHCWRV